MRIGIIGGGVYGTAIAYFLRLFGSEEVVLFEQNRLGGESTSKSAGIVRQHYSRPKHIALAARGREILESFDEKVGADAGFRQNGYLAVAGHGYEDEYAETVAAQQELGINAELLDPDELEDYVPGIDATNIAVAALERDAGFADPYLVATGFANAAANLGADLHSDTRVKAIEVADGAVTAVETEAGHEEVDCLVNAAGPWGAEVAAMVGLELPLTWYESKVVVLRADHEYGVDTPTVSDANLQMYAKPEPGGEFIVGGIDRPKVDPDCGLQGVDIEYLDLVTEALEARLPGYADAEVIESWSGIITATPDWYQIVGVPDGYENFYNVVGASGHGFKEAPAFAEAIAQDILGESPDHDLRPYRLERFEEGDLLSDLEQERKS